MDKLWWTIGICALAALGIMALMSGTKGTFHTTPAETMERRVPQQLPPSNP